MGTGTGLRRFLCPARKKRREGVRVEYKGVRAVQPESVAGRRCFEVLRNLECPVGLIENRNTCAFISTKEIWHNLDSSAEK